MKKFDKRCIYSSALSKFCIGICVFSIFLFEFILEENPGTEDTVIALSLFAPLFLIGFLCSVVYQILYYKTSGYALTETEILCNRGVLFKKHSVLDYKKIHAINKKQNLFQRFFGIAVLTVDSGSTNTAHQAEITVIEDAKVVDSLVHELNALKETGTRNKTEPSTEEEVLLSENDSLYHFTSAGKMIYSLINIASTAVFPAILGIFAITVIGFCKWMLRLDFLGSFWQYLFVAMLITLAVAFLLSLFSLIVSLLHSFVVYHDFSVTRQGKAIRISYGLLEKHTNTFSYDRIKAVKISQSLLQRAFGFATVQLEVIGYTTKSDDKNPEIGILVPFCKYAEVDEILLKILPDYLPAKKETSAVSFFPFVSWFLLIFGIITVLLLSVTAVILRLLGVTSMIVATVCVALLGVACFLLLIKLVGDVLSYRNNGLAIHGDTVTVYSGGYTKVVAVFKSKNLIAVADVTTPLRKKKGIASLVLHIKTNATSNELAVHIQKDSLSERLEKLLSL